jgi:putative ABC transport system substrate-binding protein
LLKEVAPGVTRVAVMFNPDTTPFASLYVNAIKAAAPTFGMTVTLAPVRDDPTIEQAVATLGSEPGGGLIIPPESFTVTHRATVVAAATRYSVPTIGMGDMLPKAGGLMSYWMDTIEMRGQATSYIDRILKGEKPSDLPVQQPTKFTLIINLQTAKTLGLTVPPSLLARADEVIE